MGAAATQRGDRVIARQAEYRYSEHELAVAKRQILRENQLLAKQVEQQEAELETLRAQVVELEEMRSQNALLAAALKDAEQMRDHYKTLWRELNSLHLDRIAAHNKLSEIVKLALTPEEYHHWRGVYQQLQDMVPVREE